MIVQLVLSGARGLKQISLRVTLISLPSSRVPLNTALFKWSCTANSYSEENINCNMKIITHNLEY